MILNYINKFVLVVISVLKIKILIVNFPFYMSPNKAVSTMFQIRYTLRKFLQVKTWKVA
jgi:hypothetical protein